MTATFDAIRATDILKRPWNQITDEEFAALDWPAQNKVLRDMNNLSCAQEGRTYGEAQRKRAPIDNRMQELQTIRDTQMRDWIMEGTRTKPITRRELGHAHDDEPGDEAEPDAPGML
jgi:hypothetical protein